MDEIEDDTFSAGAVALAAGSYDTPGVDMAFDDFTLWQVGEEPIVEEPVGDEPGDNPPSRTTATSRSHRCYHGRRAYL